jgi:hypothetical protein
MNSKTEHDIRQCLAVILGHESGDLETAIRTLDTLKVSATGHLGHYLTKRSYQKAWILLEGDDPEKGTCGR